LIGLYWFQVVQSHLPAKSAACVVAVLEQSLGMYCAGQVHSTDFDQAILRAVAGIEKKRSILVGMEKTVVAKHEAGHALVSTAVQLLIPTSAAVEKLSIIPRSGGALGCAPSTPSACAQVPPFGKWSASDHCDLVLPPAAQRIWR
jgi:hypothetical protein